MQITQEVYAVGGGANGFGLSEAHDCNVYLVDGGRERVLIDAGCGCDVEPLVAGIAAAGFEPTHVSHLLLTHAHADHCGGAAALRERLGLDVALSAREADALEQGDEAAISLDRARDEGIYPADFRLRPCPVARCIRHGDTIAVDRVTLRAGDLGKAEEELRLAAKKLDQAATTSTLHKNTSARKKSRMASKLHAAKAKASA